MDGSTKPKSDRTHTTYSVTTSSPSYSVTTTPFQIIEEQHPPILKNASQLSEGIDFLGDGEAPQSFRIWVSWKLSHWVHSVWFKRSSLLLILVCLILLIVRTFVWHSVLEFILGGFLVIVSIEVLILVGFYQENLVYQGWVVLDAVLVALCWYNRDISYLAFRGFRLLRALRKASGVPSLKWAVKTILRVLPRLCAIVGVLIPGMVTIFAIFLTNIYQNYFDRIDRTMLTLYQIMTGGTRWASIVDELHEEYPSAWIPIGGFVAVSLFLFFESQCGRSVRRSVQDPRT